MPQAWRRAGRGWFAGCRCREASRFPQDFQPMCPASPDRRETSRSPWPLSVTAKRISAFAFAEPANPNLRQARGCPGWRARQDQFFLLTRSKEIMVAAIGRSSRSKPAVVGEWIFESMNYSGSSLSRKVEGIGSGGRPVTPGNAPRGEASPGAIMQAGACEHPRGSSNPGNSEESTLAGSRHRLDEGESHHLPTETGKSTEAYTGRTGSRSDRIGIGRPGGGCGRAVAGERRPAPAPGRAGPNREGDRPFVTSTGRKVGQPCRGPGPSASRI